MMRRAALVLLRQQQAAAAAAPSAAAAAAAAAAAWAPPLAARAAPAASAARPRFASAAAPQPAEPEAPAAAAAAAAPSSSSADRVDLQFVHPGAGGGAPAPAAAAPAAAKAGGREGYWLMQPVYERAYTERVAPRHKPPRTFHERTGYYAVQALRGTFDLVTGYGPGKMTEAKWLTRMLYLETVAGVPGMVAGMLRHLRSLRSMRRDHGWIHTLLEEAENERMHLLTFMQVRQPGPLFRAAVLGGQAVFLSLYSLFYALSPRHCHAFVGYLEEEAVKTYTTAIADIDSGRLPEWATLPAPEIAVKYWRLGAGATMRDVLLVVRADEAAHAHVNHTFSAMRTDDTNPFAPGTHVVAAADAGAAYAPGARAAAPAPSPYPAA